MSTNKSEIQLNLSDFSMHSSKNNEKKEFTFIDLFSGIGGFRLAFESLGGKCVFSSDIDKWANETYFDNFGEYPQGDISKIDASENPNHDVLCAGYQ